MFVYIGGTGRPRSDPVSFEVAQYALSAGWERWGGRDDVVIDIGYKANREKGGGWRTTNVNFHAWALEISSSQRLISFLYLLLACLHLPRTPFS